MVNLRRPSSKQLWDGLERLGEQLEELGIEYDEVDYINN
jgi:hypothetical protein